MTDSIPPQSGSGHSQPGYGPPPNDYLVWAILVTIFCCIPGGIVAIVKSTAVGKLWAQGDLAGARAAAEHAKGWIVGSVFCGVLVGLLVLMT